MPNIYYIQVKAELNSLCQERMTVLGNFINIFDSSYLLVTESTAQSIYEHLSAGFKTSYIMVIQCDITSGAYFGYASQSLWDWINAQRPNIK